MTETHFYEFVGKKGQLYKLNANCPASEKSGTGPGSCGGKTDDELKGHFTGTEDKIEKSGFFGTKKTVTKVPVLKSINPGSLSDLSDEDLTRLSDLMDETPDGQKVLKEGKDINKFVVYRNNSDKISKEMNKRRQEKEDKKWNEEHPMYSEMKKRQAEQDNKEFREKVAKLKAEGKL